MFVRTAKEILSPAVLIIFFISCASVQQLNLRNLSPLYQTKGNTPVSRAIIFHQNDSISLCILGVRTGSLLYAKKGYSQSFTAKYRISWKLFSSYESKTILDSTHFIRTDSAFHLQDVWLYDTIRMTLKNPVSAVLELECKDINRKTKETKYISINKLNNFTSQNFLLWDTENNHPWLLPYLNNPKKVKIKINEDLSYPYVVIKHYKDNYPLPLPPFSEQVRPAYRFIPDTIFVVRINRHESDDILLNKQGFYHISLDANRQEGFTIGLFHPDFPLLTRPEDLVPPLRYLTSSNEFKNMWLAKDKKKVLDDFWLNIGGSQERAKKMIQLYYNRIQNANIFFTGFTEGWKTDKGLIYVIFGPPQIVTRENNREIWQYDENSIMLTVDFVFKKIYHPFSDNTYILERSPLLKNTWYYAIDRWRK